MNLLTQSTRLALCAACVLAQTAAFADDVKSSTVQVSTPAGTASTSVQSSSNSAGTATTVKHTAAEAGQLKTSTYHAVAGPNGAKVSQTKTNVQGNADGSVSASKAHESFKVGETGTAHHVSNSSTTVSPDGTSSSVKEETHTSKP